MSAIESLTTLISALKTKDVLVNQNVTHSPDGFPTGVITITYKVWDDWRTVATEEINLTYQHAKLLRSQLEVALVDLENSLYQTSKKKEASCECNN